MGVTFLKSREVAESRLQHLVGVNHWSLNLGTEIMHLEYSRDFGKPAIFEIPISTLRDMLSLEEMQGYIQHWEEALLKGCAGPTTLSFIKADGTRALVESACSPCLCEGQRLLVGVFKRLPEAAKPNRNFRIMAEFLESFIENSPSGIVVADATGRIVSANREFLHFVGKTDKAAVLRKPVLEVVLGVDSGLATTLQKAFQEETPQRGSYEMIFDDIYRQTLYWRIFPLTGTESQAPPKVFAFDLNQKGPQAA